VVFWVVFLTLETEVVVFWVVAVTLETAVVVFWVVVEPSITPTRRLDPLVPEAPVNVVL
jgi:hypothetical protein